jgi:hypothetical protein
LGWHCDPWDDGRANKNATWHACCVVAWTLWNTPTDHLKTLKLRQGRKCPVTGRRLLKMSEVDHRVPLFAVWSEHRQSPWPRLLDFWGAPNLQVINKSAHLEKCSREATERAERRALAVTNDQRLALEEV